VPFGGYEPSDVVRSRRRYIADGVEFVLGQVCTVDADAGEVHLASGRRVGYDYLIIATGTSPRPDQTPGMLGMEWRRSIFDFYSIDGATALRGALGRLESGRVVVHVTDMPIKCPVAPPEFTFLADASGVLACATGSS
jgi:sulfide:quinone oxidoreductase